MKPKDWEQFLREITIDYGLKGKLKDIFMVRFAYENWRKPDTEVWELAEAASHETYKKQMTELYRYFTRDQPNGCPELDAHSKGPGKFSIVRDWLKDVKYPQWKPDDSAINSPFIEIIPTSGEDNIYIPRPPVENDCFAEIKKPGALIRLKAPEKMGKTFLLNTLLNYATTLNYGKVYLNLRGVEGAMLSDLDKFLRWFSANIARELGLKPNLDDYWEEDLFGSLSSCKIYMESYILPELSQPLILGLDNVDRLFDYTAIAQDFLPMLRAWHEEGNNSEIWQNLRLVIANSTEAHLKLDDNQSPFNVGRPIKLPGFTLAQMEQLAQHYPLNIDHLSTFLEDLRNLVGGHPYLSRLALENLQKQRITPTDLLKEAPTQGGIYGFHLRRHWNNLQASPELAEGMKKVVQSETGVKLDPIVAYRLESMGLISLSGDEAQASCLLYLQYFRDNL